MLERDDWLPLARKLDWEFSYVSERDVFPETMSGAPWLPGAAWQHWEEPYRTSYREYVAPQHRKEAAVQAVRGAIGRPSDFARLHRGWLSAVKLHAAGLALAEVAAVVGNLRAARYAAHESVVQRILTGKAPANLLALLRSYLGLSQESWGKDVARGDYPWLAAEPLRSEPARDEQRLPC